MSANDDALFGRFEPVARDTWRAVVERDLAGASFERRLVTRTAEGLALQPLYEADDESTTPNIARSSSHVSVIQRHAQADPEAARLAIAEDLAGGVDGITLQFDVRACTTRAGTGLGGVAVSDARRLARTLEAVDLSVTPIRLEAGAGALAAAAMLIAIADRQRVARGDLSGCLGIDPFAARVTADAIGSDDDAMRHACAAACWSRTNAPNLRPIRLSSRPWHEAGAHAVRDLAFTLAAGVSTLRSLDRVGISPTDAAGMIELEVAIGRDVFVELARLRALRLTWARVLQACGVAHPSPQIRIHAETSVRTLTMRDPWVNALRATHQTIAALVGGADSVTVRPYDDRSGLSSTRGRRLARNTALVLVHESHLDHVVDPGAGSGYIDALTDEMADRAWAEMQAIEAAGGLWTLLASGEAERRVHEDREARDRRIRDRSDAITGTSEYPDLGEPPPETPCIDERLASREDAEAFMDATVIDAALAKVEALRLTDPLGLMDAAIAAAAAGASVADLARRTWADEPVPTAQMHLAPDGLVFEALRDAADRAETIPTAFAVTWGSLAEYKARLGWARNLFAAGGVRLVSSETTDAATVAEAFAASGHKLAVLAASDARFAESGPAVVAALREAGATEVWVAGRATDVLRDAGVDRFVHLGVDVVDALEAAHRCIGVSA